MEPRSSITQPSPWRAMRACWREISMSLASLPSPGAARPIRNSSSDTSMSVPAAFPPITLSTSAPSTEPTLSPAAAASPAGAPAAAEPERPREQERRPRARRPRRRRRGGLDQLACSWRNGRRASWPSPSRSRRRAQRGRSARLSVTFGGGSWMCAYRTSTHAALEGKRPGEALVEDAAERIDVQRRSAFLPRTCSGAVYRSCPRTPLGGEGDRVGRGVLAEAEVGQVALPLLSPGG